MGSKGEERKEDQPLLNTDHCQVHCRCVHLSQNNSVLSASHLVAATKHIKSKTVAEGKDQVSRGQGCWGTSGSWAGLREGRSVLEAWGMG